VAIENIKVRVCLYHNLTLQPATTGNEMYQENKILKFFGLKIKQNHLVQLAMAIYITTATLIIYLLMNGYFFNHVPH
jgi:hypothetical protein